jgi:Tfp pilus assembly protein PilF/mono/diheme cytochrome c family protein
MNFHLQANRLLVILCMMGASLLLIGGLVAISSQAQSPAHPTFARDIAPIIYHRCASCHHASDSNTMSGSSSFALLSYEEVKQHADEIVSATSSHSMPPWLPEPGYGEFAEENRLTAREIQVIAEWVREGAQAGNTAEAPPAPQFVGGWQLGKPDLVIDAVRPVSIPASGPDMFWNFVFSPNLKSTRYVRAIEINPGSGLDMVHHANLMVDPARSGRRQEPSPGAGFPGMDLMLEHNPLEIPSHFLFWKPGAKPWVEPDGLAWKLDPGTDLILNAHFMPMGMTQEAKPSIGLYFTDKPPNRLPILIELQNDDALDIPAGARDFTVKDDFRLPLDVDVLAIYPHAHYLGHVLEGYATLPNGQRKWLIRIPDWNPDWQAVFHYREPVFLPKGTVLSMRYSFDNSTLNPRNPNSPPRRVQGGNQATDEMAHLWFQLLPHDSVDGRVQIQSAILEHRVEKYPDDFQSRLALGALLLARLNPSSAVKVLEQAVILDPKQEEARRYLGMALEAVGRSGDAIIQLRVAVQMNPEDTQARYNLARLLVKAGKLDEAVEDFRKIVSASPQNAQYHDDLGELLMQQKKPAEALEQFNAALALDGSLKSALQDRELAQSLLQSSAPQ